jgi:single-strand DNA-binding protein
MEGKNFVQLVGYVGQDIKRSTSKQGMRVAIRVATHFPMADAGDEKLYKTTWHNVVAWDNQAAYADGHLVKGSRVLVEGRLVYGSFVGKDGSKRFSAHVRAENLLNLDH